MPSAAFKANVALGAIRGDKTLAGVADAARCCQQRLAMLPDEYKRLEYPHQYKVGVSDRLHDLRNALRRRYAAGGKP